MGGAVLGSYPHITYDAFLRRLGDDAGVVEGRIEIAAATALEATDLDGIEPPTMTPGQDLVL